MPKPVLKVPRVVYVATCPECGREFDLRDESEADEFYNGHDCEV